jgi:FdrA protein
MIRVQLRPGAYYDSVVLMQLQRGLAALPGVEDAGVVMGTPANKDVLAQSDLLTPAAQGAGIDDLIIAVRAHDDAAALAALAQVDALLAQKASHTSDFRPRSIETAVQLASHAAWLLVSVPGRFAAAVARQGLDHGRHVFLYSDNVSLDDEIALKREAAARGLLVMGPDCGTAIVNGVGLGFANAVRRGPIGVIGASGTGLQLVTARIHQLGSGITHALGTGGRDLAEAVGAITARQALDLLGRDPATRVIVIVSKPPAPAVAARLIAAARTVGKPVVIDFIGYHPAEPVQDNVYFARTLDGAAELAVELAAIEDPALPADLPPFARGQRYLRGVFSGGTLAYEAQLLLRDYVPLVWANAPLDKAQTLPNALQSQEHTIVDLGEDEFTVGRLHPMLDHDLRLKRIAQEAADPTVAVLLVDVVLGHGAHPDPAAELAPALAAAKAHAAAEGRHLEIVAVVVGTDADPQYLHAQVTRLEEAGAYVATSNEAAVTRAGALIRALNPPGGLPEVDARGLAAPFAAINAGLESFAASLAAQGAEVVHVDWRPPAGGNEKLMGILSRLKTKATTSQPPGKNPE